MRKKTSEHFETCDTSAALATCAHSQRPRSFAGGIGPGSISVNGLSFTWPAIGVVIRHSNYCSSRYGLSIRAQRHFAKFPSGYASFPTPFSYRSVALKRPGIACFFMAEYLAEVKLLRQLVEYVPHRVYGQLKVVQLLSDHPQ